MFINTKAHKTARGEKMLDEYYRNGELFLAEMERSKQKDLAQSNNPEAIANIQITDEFIKMNFREPIKELVGDTNIGDASTEKEMLKALMKYFEVSGRSSEILDASFLSTEKGRCSYCGEEKDVFPNRAYIFPFERKIDSITPEEARQLFCKKCGFTLYSGMAYLYQNQKGSVMFFFDSYNLEHIKKMSIPIKKELRDPSNFNKLKKFGIPTFHPHETIFVTLFEFVKYLHKKKLVKDFEDTIGNVRLVLVAGSGQIYHQRYVEGNVLDKVSKFFLRLIDEGIENWRNMNEAKRPKKTTAEDLIFAGFFNNLTVNKGDFKGDFSENCRLREEFTKALLNEKIDFITINEIIMERLKKGERVAVPYHYRNFITTFMEVFNMEKELFEKINGLGYALGKQMKGTNLENFVWDVFRARGAEQFYNSIVELQAKLKTSIDLRAINEYEKGWREAKAILLNGMLNALHGGN